MLRRLALAIAGAAALTGAAPALAADHSGTLSGNARTFKWDTNPGPAADPLAMEDCAPAEIVAAGMPAKTVRCYSTLIHVADNGDEEPGQLVVSITGDDTLTRTDLALYASNAEGEQLEELGSVAPIGQESRKALVAEALPGYYLAVTTHRTGYGVVHGTAELLGDDQEFSVAAPEKKTTLNSAKSTYTWSGAGQGAVFDCGEVLQRVQPCDYVLVHTTEMGDLNLTMSNASPTTVWNVASLHRSNKAGTWTDEDQIGGVNTPGSPNGSTGGAGLEPGYYVFKIGWLAAANATYDGTITFTPTPPEEEGEEETF